MPIEVPAVVVPLLVPVTTTAWPPAAATLGTAGSGFVAVLVTVDPVLELALSIVMTGTGAALPATCVASEEVPIEVPAVVVPLFVPVTTTAWPPATATLGTPGSGFVDVLVSLETVVEPPPGTLKI